MGNSKRRGEEKGLLDIEAQHLSAIVDSMAIGVIAVSRDGRLFFWNRASARILGIGDHVEPGVPVEEVIEQPALLGAIRRALSPDQPPDLTVSGEVEGRTPESGVVITHISPVRGHKGGVHGIVCTLDNVTFLEGKNRAHSQFISMVTHELRAPLAAVEEYLAAYLTGAAGTDPTVNRRMLERARERAHSLLDLVNDLLQYSRLESGKIGKTKELLDLSEVIESTVELMRSHDQGKELEITVNIVHPLPGIEANREEMELVFTNLVSNAMKYNVKRGRIEITAQKDKEFVQVKIADTGIGISKEDLPRIFDEFFRVSGPETRYITGTGLGLSIVKRIVDAYAGSIDVETEPGKGTILTVKFPARRAMSSKGQDKKGRSHGERIEA